MRFVSEPTSGADLRSGLWVGEAFPSGGQLQLEKFQPVKMQRALHLWHTVNRVGGDFSRRGGPWIRPHAFFTNSRFCHTLPCLSSSSFLAKRNKDVGIGSFPHPHHTQHRPKKIMECENASVSPPCMAGSSPCGAPRQTTVKRCWPQLGPLTLSQAAHKTARRQVLVPWSGRGGNRACCLIHGPAILGSWSGIQISSSR